MHTAAELFEKWVHTLAREWKVDDRTACHALGGEEAEHRLEVYPTLRERLLRDPVSWPDVLESLGQCWALGDRFDQIRFNRFWEEEDEAKAAIRSLLGSAAIDPPGAINEFVARAVSLGYQTPKGGSDRAGAAQLASLLLTCVWPDTYVDFRRNRWAGLAEAVEAPGPPSGSDYAGLLLWAGRFASSVGTSPMFAEVWPGAPVNWVVAGLCWSAKDPKPPVADPLDPAEFGAFPEGRVRRRSHLARERNGSVVRLAKELREQEDPMLCCEVCGFSYVQQYGSRGKGFIEAHHIVPLADLRPGTPTRAEDLALLCANCHRMVHRTPTCSLEELRALLGE